MSDAAPAAKRAAPWRGRKRTDDPRKAFVAVRCTAAEHAASIEAAARAGMEVGPYLRTQALGSPGPRAKRRPPIEREALARALGLIGLYGSNVNQLAYVANTSGDLPTGAALLEMAGHVREMRNALRRALGRGD